MTDVSNLSDLANELMEAARASSAGRSAKTVHGGRGKQLRQTVLAMRSDVALGEHDSPGEATLQVLSGRVRLSAEEGAWELAAGELVEIPPTRHDLAALEDSVVILTVVVELN